MALQYWWWLVAIGLGIAEMFTGSFYLLVLAAGGAGAGIFAALGFGMVAQLLCAAVISAAGAALVRGLRPLRNEPMPSQRNPDVNLDIGQSVQVEQWDASGRARVPHRGALWDAELMPGEPAVPGRHVIREIQGSRLRLSRASPAASTASASSSPQ